jgi:succinyl-CoA synthetase alpha subunit
MGIFVDKRTRIVVQGITGREGRFHALRMRDYNPDTVVAGVTPGRGGQDVEGIPVFDTVYSEFHHTLPPVQVFDARHAFPALIRTSYGC